MVLVLSGPNLGLLGTRQPAVYGSATLDDHVAAATEEAGPVRAWWWTHLSASDHEGDLVSAVGRARVGGDRDGFAADRSSTPAP